MSSTPKIRTPRTPPAPKPAKTAPARASGAPADPSGLPGSTPAAADGFQASKAAAAGRVGAIDGKDLAVDDLGRVSWGGEPAPSDEVPFLKEILQRIGRSPDCRTLAELGRGLAETVRRLNRTTGMEDERLGLLQARAFALRALEEAAVRAGRLGDTPTRDNLARLLVRAAADEPNRELRDYTLDRLDRQGRAGRLPPTKAASEAIYPSRPPYEQWLRDGVITVEVVCDESGSTLKEADKLFGTKLGMQKTDLPDGTAVYRKGAEDGRPAVEVHLAPPLAALQAKGTSLFSAINDPKVDVILFGGHSSYNHMVADALAKSPPGTGEGKLIALFQCWGAGNIEMLERAFPSAQLLSTTEATDNLFDYPAIEILLDSFRSRESWDLIGGKLKRMLHEVAAPIDWAAKFDLDNHFFLPISRVELGKYYDRDHDGVPDAAAQDQLFEATRPARPGALGGYDPCLPDRPTSELRAEALPEAVNELSHVLRYTHMLPKKLEAKVAWSPKLWAPAGFFTPKPGDLRAFDIEAETDASTGRRTGRVTVKLSPLFAHASNRDLARMLAIEAGDWVAKQTGLKGADKTTLSLGMLERVVHQQRNWHQSTTLLEQPWLEDELLFRRYGLEGVTIDALKAATEDPSDYLEKHHQQLRKWVLTRPGLEVAADGPRALGTPLTVPERLQIVPPAVERHQVEALLPALGLRGGLVDFGPRELAKDIPQAVALRVRPPGGADEVILLGLDATGTVRSASRLAVPLARLHDRAALAYLGFLALQPSDEPRLQEPYRRAREKGAGLVEAIDAGLAEARKTRVPGSFVWRDFPGLTNLEAVGLISKEELDAVRARFDARFPQGEAAQAEQLLMGWATSIKGVDGKQLQEAYTSAAVSEEGPQGFKKGVLALLDALPRPLPNGAATSLNLWLLLRWGLLPREGADEIATRFCERTGTSRAQLLVDAVSSEINSGFGMAADVAKRVGEEASQKGAVPGEIALAMLDAAAKVGGQTSLPESDPGLLSSLGLLSPAEAEAFKARLAALRAPNA